MSRISFDRDARAGLAIFVVSLAAAILFGINDAGAILSIPAGMGLALFIVSVFDL